jgi:hypothetical protein
MRIHRSSFREFVVLLGVIAGCTSSSNVNLQRDAAAEHGDSGGLGGTGGAGTGGSAGGGGAGGALDGGAPDLGTGGAGGTDAADAGGEDVSCTMDMDFDTTPDCRDGCPMDPNKTAPGMCGCGMPDADGDGDGVLDCMDACPFDRMKTTPGMCGCGLADVDSDHDNVLDCMDRCPMDGTRTAPGVCGCGVADTAPFCLAHRYTFDGTGTTVTDSVGTAHGTAVNASLSGTGAIVLGGGTTDQYVRLPPGIISAMGDSATFEAWVTWNPQTTPTNSAGPWQRIFDFGNSDQADGVQGTGQTYIFLTPRNGSTQLLRVAITQSSNGAETLVDGPIALPTAAVQAMSHVAVVVDGTAKTLALYLNGVPQGQTTLPDGNKLSTLHDVNNWLGRSQWVADQEFAGTLHEFRIYSAARSAADIAASFAAGPNALPGGPPSDGGTGGAGGAGGATDAGAGGAGGSAPADASAPPDAPADAAPDPCASDGGDPALDCCPDDPAKTRAGACGCGVADTDGDGDGVPDCNDRCPSDPAKAAPGVCGCNAPDGPLCLVHRYSFDGAGTVVTDTAGHADGVTSGVMLSGTGTVVLAGGTSNQFVDLPNRLLSPLTSATLEAWLTWPGTGGVWQRVFDFGSTTGAEGVQGTGQTYFMLTVQSGGANTLRTAFTVSGPGGEVLAEVPRTAFPAGARTHVAVVFDDANRSLSLYLNGMLRALATFPDASYRLSALNDVNDWLGRSQFPDPALAGTFDELRIYSVARTAAQIQASAAAGPDALPAQ